MRAMILAAGEGRRMQPLTFYRAKPSLPILGVPLVVHAARLLRSAGIREIVVNLHRQPRTVRQALEGELSNPLAAAISDVHFEFSQERELLGTGGGIGRVREWLAEQGPAVVLNSDFLSDIDLPSILDHHRRSEAAATFVGVEPAGPFRGELWQDEQGRVVSIGPNPPDGGSAGGPLVFAGVQVIEPDLLATFPDSACDSVRDVYPPAVSDRRLGVVKHPGWWWEYGDIDRYLDGQLDLVREGRCVDAGTLVDAGEGPGAGIAWMGPGADVPLSDVTVKGVVIVSAGASVRPGAELEDVLLLEHARVPAACRLTRCIVGTSTILTGGSRFEGVAIASAPCAPPPGLANAPETPGGRPAPPEGCRAEGDLWTREIPRQKASGRRPRVQTAKA